MGKIEDAINSAPNDWMFTFTAEDQSRKLSELTDALKEDVNETGDGKQVPSGFSYWGVVPTIAWAFACNDPLYRVMYLSQRSYSTRWTQLRSFLANQAFHYVSLGVGTGHKDSSMVQDLSAHNPELYYFPVDMSQEMLRLGAKEVLSRTNLPRKRIVPIQLDFLIYRNVDDLRRLLDGMLGDSPILFSLLGNTLANFDADIELMRILARLARPADRFLVEVATTDTLEPGALREAANEYSNSPQFRKFVVSALLQNTDLHADSEEVQFLASAEADRAIRIHAVYQNRTDQQLMIALPDGNRLKFPPRDTIRLYLTRKYTSAGIDEFVKAAGFVRLGSVKPHPDDTVMNMDPRRPHYNLGTELLLLAPTAESASLAWESVFISYGEPDREFANTLRKALTDKGLTVFMFSTDGVPGDQLANLMYQGVYEHDRTILICSQHSLDRQGVLNELTLVRDREANESGSRRLVPITLDQYVYNDWKPRDGHLLSMVRSRIISDFVGADRDSAKFNASLNKLLEALKR
jgi:L-histidine Nalpha-methyltransferase